MKTFIFSLACVVALAATVYSQSLTVHEWGTFTTLHGSDGGTLSGLYFEEEQLPSFVYHHPGFSPDPKAIAGNPRPCKNVTVKMETPVLYFYSDTERQVRVHVDFPNGTISQWYPNRSGGEAAPTGDTVAMGEGQTGSIDWNATVLAPDTKEQMTQQSVSAKWYNPRQTDANLVKNADGEVEKYLFYRGLANFGLPLDVKFIDSLNLKISNTSNFDIPFFYIYDHISNTNMEGIWGIGPLKAGETHVFHVPQKYYNVGDHIPQTDSLRVALENAGLKNKEASAMLATWSDGYFLTTGFKIFWIVPRELTDKILPLAITPKPDSLVRVLVAKTEVLHPSFEARLLADYKAGKTDGWSNDRYHLAYMQRAKQLAATEDVKVTASSDKITISPNPASSMIHIQGIGDGSQVTVQNILGEKVLSVKNATELDVSKLSAGLYFVSIKSGYTNRTIKLLKQ